MYLDTLSATDFLQHANRYDVKVEWFSTVQRVNTVDMAFSMKLSSDLWRYQVSEQGNVNYIYSDVICCF